MGPTSRLKTPPSTDESAVLCVRKADYQLRDGRITKCEAFARAMECLARLVLDAPRGTPVIKQQKFLDLAWNYLVDKTHQADYEPLWRYPAGRRRWAGVPPVWTDEVNNATPCSGWVQPFPNDPVGDITGRAVHFLMNAALVYRRLVGPALRAGHEKLVETSPTDLYVNQTGFDFGTALKAGQITSANIADWIRKRLCTEVVRMSLYYSTKKGPGTDWWDVFAVDEKSEYHDVRFELKWSCEKEQKDEWDASVFVKGGTGFLSIQDFKILNVNLGEYPTKQSRRELAQRESGRVFRSKPSSVP